MQEKTPVKSRRDEYREQTREALVQAGREIFASSGFAKAGTEAIARSARVTRGAFYHHFEDKHALFDAVVEQMSAEVSRKILASTKSKTNLWDKLYAGVDSFLDACTDKEYSTIVIQNAPAVLGERRFREIEETHATALLISTIDMLAKDREIECDDTLLLSRMINAMVCQIAVLMPVEQNGKALRRRGIKMVKTCLDAFRPV